MTASVAVPDVERAPYASDQIAEHYRDKMRRGELQVGDTLPTNRALVAEWKVSNRTAQRAIRVLREEGLVESRPAKAPLIIALPKSGP